MLKDKAAPLFICIPAVLHVVFSLHALYIYTLYYIFPHMHVFSLQFTVQFLLYAADIQMLTGLFGAGSLVQEFSPGIIKAHFKHVQCDCHTNTVILLFHVHLRFIEGYTSHMI